MLGLVEGKFDPTDGGNFGEQHWETGWTLHAGSGDLYSLNHRDDDDDHFEEMGCVNMRSPETIKWEGQPERLKQGDVVVRPHVPRPRTHLVHAAAVCDAGHAA